MLLAVQKFPRVAEHYLEAAGHSGVLGRGEADAVAERLHQVRLEAVVEPHVASAAAVHHLFFGFVLMLLLVAVSRAEPAWWRANGM